MDEHDVVEAGTDLLFGDPKSVLKKIGLSILDKKQFEAIFVSAGKTVAEYEKDNTEQNDIRRILFCEETMRLLANEIRKSNSFDWLKDLDRCVNDLLSLSELDSINKARCKKHFEDIVIYQIKKLFPQRYGSYCLGDIHDNVNSLMASTQSSNETLNKILELMSQNDGEYNQKSPTTHEDWQDNSSYTLLEWHLERAEVDGIFAHKDSYTDDIIKLTEAWQKERDEYPGWYIIPYNTAVELNMYTDEKGLLQKHETVNIDVMLDFAYELCWRRIKIMSDMELSLISSIYDINNRLGLLLLVRCSSTGTIEKLVNRKFVMDLESGYIDDVLDILINVIEVNIGEIIAMGNGFSEYLAGHIRENVPILLQRFSSRASERMQKKELQFIQKIMSYRNIPPRFEVTQLMDKLLRQISERMKVKLLPLMMETEIVEQVTMHSRVDGSNGIDIFDCYFNKQGLDTLFEEYHVLIDEDVINWLLKDDWKSDYEWKTKVVRLKILDEYHLLNTKQHDEYVKLLWSNIEEKTQLPKLAGYYLWVYETLPYIDESIPKLSVKNYFITNDIAKDSNDLYLKQLTLLCANTELGYWNENDVLIIINKISKYWYKIAENTANIMFEDNSRKAVYAIAAVLENCNGMISDEAREILIKLAHEMNEKGIYTKCFDIFILRDEQWERDVQENIFAMNESQSIDSLRAMEKYIIRYPDSITTSEMLGKIVELIELRKEPGLLSAIWILHNLVYAKNTVIDTIGIERIDRLLFFLAELINYDNAAMKDIKHCIELRQACAALAFRLFDWKTVNCGKGVEKWREICKSSDEANEVRNQWIW